MSVCVSLLHPVGMFFCVSRHTGDSSGRWSSACLEKIAREIVDKHQQTNKYIKKL